MCVYGLVASWGTYSRSVPHPLAASWGRRLSSIFGAAPHAVLRLPLTGSATVSAGGPQAIGSGAWSPDVACLFYTETMLVAAAFAHTASSGIDGGANEGGSADASGAGSGDSSADGGADGGIGGGADADGSGDGEPALSGDPAELSGIVVRFGCTLRHSMRDKLVHYCSRKVVRFGCTLRRSMRDKLVHYCSRKYGTLLGRLGSLPGCWCCLPVCPRVDDQNSPVGLAWQRGFGWSVNWYIWTGLAFQHGSR